MSHEVIVSQQRQALRYLSRALSRSMSSLTELSLAFEAELDVREQVERSVVLGSELLLCEREKHQRELADARAVGEAQGSVAVAQALRRVDGVSKSHFMGAPDECFLCRKVIPPGEPVFFATLGVDDEPSTLGSAGESPLVEERTEFGLCAGCRPLVQRQFERLCMELWGARAPDGARQEPAPAAVVDTGAAVP